MQLEIRSSKRNIDVVDLCQNTYVKSIKCDVPCSEGYGPENLTASSFPNKNKGFMVERFIKPPVTLVVEFKGEVDVKYISINCYVGAQKTTGIELFSQSKTKTGLGLYASLASGLLSDDKKGFVFHSYIENVKHKYSEEYCFQRFKSSRFLYTVKRLKFKIFRTNQTSLAALGKVEIWGLPHKYNHYRPTILLNSPTTDQRRFGDTRPSSSTVTDTSNLIQKCDNPSDKCLEESFTNPAKSDLGSICGVQCNELSGPLFTNPSLSALNGIDEHISVPDDFIDPITCDIMIQPIILPSGKVVDNSTLELYNKSELVWGRGPSDPFTGIPFSNLSKPVAAPDLKTRIDKFLTANCNKNELSQVPRTLGSDKSLHFKSQVKTEFIVSKLVAQSLPTVPTGSYFPAAPSNSKIKRIHEKLELSPTHSKDSEATGNSLKSKQDDVKITRSLEKNNLGLFHEQTGNSFELALKSTLSKLKKFSETTNRSDLLEVMCYDCKSTENLFSIPCSHYVCRTCLVGSGSKCTKKCSTCGYEYQSSNVQKVHSIKPNSY